MVCWRSCASYNNKNSYPYAMAEKRAKDRVILKLIGVAGFVYSEDEADAFKEERPDSMGGVPQPEPEKPARSRRHRRWMLTTYPLTITPGGTG